eukprot:TRINITY_DN8409_c0_g1_i2.p1 TRINITY_DN8409_c0_g1~~TRINITY_DN8409_c0_g1_i2.p1  ORF type:complete len:161 (+),score=27.98 TRINITY_DN8409_c0_g1_i2:64-546(+)
MTSGQATAKELCRTGNQHYAEGQFLEAVAAYSKALEMTEDVHLLSNRSAACLNIGRADLALQDARKCIELKPTWSKGYVKAALALRILGQYGEASLLLERASELDPSDQYIKVLEKTSITEDYPPQHSPVDRASQLSSPKIGFQNVCFFVNSISLLLLLY